MENHNGLNGGGRNSRNNFIKFDRQLASPFYRLASERVRICLSISSGQFWACSVVVCPAR